MPGYEVFVASSDGVTTIPIMDTDDPKKASDLIAAICGVSGSTSYRLGVDIKAGTPPPGTLTPEGAAKAQPPEGHDAPPPAKGHPAPKPR